MLCRFCNDIVSPTANGTGIVKFIPCKHKAHLACVFLNGNHTTCVCATSVKTVPSSLYDEHLMHVATLTKQTAFDSALASNNNKSFSTIMSLKNRVVGMQTMAEASKEVIGTSPIDTIQPILDNRIGVYIRSWLSTLNTLDDVSNLVKLKNITYSVLYSNELSIQEILDHVAKKLGTDTFAAFPILGIDSFEKMCQLGLVVEQLFEPYHGIFPPDKMCSIMGFNASGLLKIVNGPMDVCKLKYPPSVMQKMGLNVNNLVDNFGFNGDHVVEASIALDHWIMYLGLTNKNYDKLKLTNSHLTKIGWNADDVTSRLDLLQKLNYSKVAKWGTSHASERPNPYALSSGVKVPHVVTKKPNDSSLTSSSSSSSASKKTKRSK